VRSVRACLPARSQSVRYAPFSFHVRDAAAQVHDLAGCPLMMSAYECQVGIPVARLYERIERALSGRPSRAESDPACSQTLRRHPRKRERLSRV